MLYYFIRYHSHVSSRSLPRNEFHAEFDHPMWPTQSNTASAFQNSAYCRDHGLHNREQPLGHPTCYHELLQGRCVTAGSHAGDGEGLGLP